MAFRSDIVVDYIVSPRVITVLSPSVELTIQDLIDTVRILEEMFIGLSYPKLINAAGKEPLGGGVLVGITATLQNARIAFEARPGPSFVQCNISGGNLVAVDDLGAPINVVQTTAFTQVILTSSSSATLQESAAIEFSSFNGCVTMDVTSSNT